MISRLRYARIIVVVAIVFYWTGVLSDYLCPNVLAVETSKSALSEQIKTAENLSAVFEHVAENVRPFVVSISSVKLMKPEQQKGQIPDWWFEFPFRDFFGNQNFDRFFNQDNRGDGYVQQGLGTGVIVDPAGYILTNNHVVEEADEVTVTLFDERTFKAKIVGTDPKTDVAVVKIDAGGLRSAVLGDSDRLRVGEWVVAAGNPFALTSTITAGIVSAKGRSNVGIVDYEDFIQTDAAINPGNSGGPLANLRGEVVGINTAIFSQSGGYSGVGFAIPSNMTKSVMKSLIEKGRVIRGHLGVAIQNLTEELAKSFGYDSTDGVLVSDITPQGPADKAGLKQGDIITRFDGKTIKDTVQLRSLVAATQPDRTVQVEVIRNGRKETIAVKIGELESKQVQKQSEQPETELGMRVETITPEIARQLGRADLRGVIVTSIDPLGAAAKAGIRTYDVVLDVQGRAVASVAEFERELKKYDLKKGVRLRVQSAEMQHFVFIMVQ